MDEMLICNKAEECSHRDTCPHSAPHNRFTNVKLCSMVCDTEGAPKDAICTPCKNLDEPCHEFDDADTLVQCTRKNCHTDCRHRAPHVADIECSLSCRDDCVCEPVEAAEPVTKQPELKSSGRHQTFATGAIRDIPDGKTRWSLLPPCAWHHAIFTQTKPVTQGDTSVLTRWFADVEKFIGSGKPEWLQSAFSNVIRNEPDAVDRLAAHLGLGATKYGAYNWVLGQPVTRCIDSLGRHLHALRNNAVDEDHFAAALCNTVFIITFYQQGPSELLDFPGYGVRYG